MPRFDQAKGFPKPNRKDISTKQWSATRTLMSASEFPVGTNVRLHGLSRAEFNSHVGKIVKNDGGDRVGVRLHGVVWGEDHLDRHHQPVALRPTNLSKLKRFGGEGESLTFLECPPR